MDKDQIIKILSDRLKDDGLYFLAVLDRLHSPILKEQLRDAVNEHYEAKRGKKLINSRYTLDIWTARLEGAGLVDVTEVGRARLYSLTNLGRYVIEYRKQLLKNQ
jgi:DNA-binding transcriptional ArsR family regulator